MVETFTELGVVPELVEALAKKDVTAPFAIQNLTIADALAGRDVCGKAKTGSGKTLAFGLPAVQLVSELNTTDIGCVIMVPTRELATQVLEEVQYLGAAVGVNATAVYGGANIEKQIAKLEGDINLLVATPGRLIDLLDRGAVSISEVKLVILDEADRMADMGFMPQVEWILRKVKGQHQTLLFSATLDGAVDVLVKRYQHDPVHHEVASKEVTVENMTHLFLAVHDMDKAKVLGAIVGGAKKVIVFCNTKRSCDRLNSDLDKLDVSSEVIHGDLRQRHREKALEKFTKGESNALIATDVAARGIHVDDVDVVVHFDPPEDHKTYLHRSGRTARAGEDGIVVTLMLWNQELTVKRLQKRMSLERPIVEVFSNNEKLRELESFSE